MFMPKSSLKRWVRVLAILLGILHIVLVNLLSISSTFLIYGLENGVV